MRLNQEAKTNLWTLHSRGGIDLCIITSENRTDFTPPDFVLSNHIICMGLCRDFLNKINQVEILASRVAVVLGQCVKLACFGIVKHKLRIVGIAEYGLLFVIINELKNELVITLGVARVKHILYKPRLLGVEAGRSVNLSVTGEVIVSVRNRLNITLGESGAELCTGRAVRGSRRVNEKVALIIYITSDRYARFAVV